MPGQRDEDSYSPGRPFERGPGQSGFKLTHYPAVRSLAVVPHCAVTYSLADSVVGLFTGAETPDAPLV
jgi:hypothetical protein